MLTFNRYINKIDHVWYDSSNLEYSACYDNDTDLHTLKVVFKSGKTYVYHNVTSEDYLMFKNAESNGSIFNKHIVKNYKGFRLSDTDLEELEEQRKKFQEETNEIYDAVSKLAYIIEVNKETNEIRLTLNNRVVFEGVEGKINLLDVLNSMNIPYKISESDMHCKTEEDFINEDLIKK